MIMMVLVVAIPMDILPFALNDTRTTVASYLPIGAWRHYVQLCVGRRYLLYPSMRFVRLLLFAVVHSV